MEELINHPFLKNVHNKHDQIQRLVAQVKSKAEEDAKPDARLVTRSPSPDPVHSHTPASPPNGKKSNALGDTSLPAAAKPTTASSDSPLKRSFDGKDMTTPLVRSPGRSPRKHSESQPPKLSPIAEEEKSAQKEEEKEPTTPRSREKKHVRRNTKGEGGKEDDEEREKAKKKKRKEEKTKTKKSKEDKVKKVPKHIEKEEEKDQHKEEELKQQQHHQQQHAVEHHGHDYRRASTGNSDSIAGGSSGGGGGGVAGEGEGNTNGTQTPGRAPTRVTRLDTSYSNLFSDDVFWNGRRSGEGNPKPIVPGFKPESVADADDRKGRHRSNPATPVSPRHPEHHHRSNTEDLTTTARAKLARSKEEPNPKKSLEPPAVKTRRSKTVGKEASQTPEYAPPLNLSPLASPSFNRASPASSPASSRSVDEKKIQQQAQQQTMFTIKQGEQDSECYSFG